MRARGKTFQTGRHDACRLANARLAYRKAVRSEILPKADNCALRAKGNIQRIVAKTSVSKDVTLAIAATVYFEPSLTDAAYCANARH